MHGGGFQNERILMRFFRESLIAFADYVAERQDVSLAEKMRGCPLFDPDWYLAQNLDVAEAKVDPFEHYIYNGWLERRSPGPYFDVSWYMERYPDIRQTGAEPLGHFIIAGMREGREFRFVGGREIFGFGPDREIHVVARDVEPGPVDAFESKVASPRVGPASLPAAAFELYAEWIRRFGEVAIDRGMPCTRVMPAAAAFFAELVLRLSGSPCVVVLVGGDLWAADSREGYVQRIIAIDDVLRGMARVYLNAKPDLETEWSVEAWRSGAAMVNLRIGTPVADLLLVALTGGGPLYVHSIHSLGSVAVRNAVLRAGDRVTLDVHGAVPEENMLMGWPDVAAIFGEIEADVVPRVGRVVVVSQSMRNHLAAKHHVADLEAISCPVFPNMTPRRGKNGVDHMRLRVIYAGGTQAWQSVDAMASSIRERADDCDFTILTPNVDVFRTALLKAGAPVGRVDLRSVDPAEVPQILADHHLGFVLREDSVINRVACPTKMIEYLSTDVVPILDCPAIGDFVALGMEYVTVDAFNRGKVPDPTECRRMAATNRQVLKRLEALSEAGHQAIRDAISASSSEPRGGVARPGMNIGLVLTSMAKGGLEQVVLSLYRSYRKLGARVTVFLESDSLGTLSLAVDDQDDVVLLRGNADYFIASCLKREISILHYHYNVFMLEEMTKLGFVTIYTLHNIYTWFNDRDFLARFDTLAAASEITAVSSFVAEYAMTRYQIGPQRVRVVGNGVDWSNDRSEAKLRKRDFNLSEDLPVVALIASFAKNKHHMLAIGAAEELAARGVEFTLVFVGDVLDPEHHRAVTERLQASPCAGRIRSLGYLPNKTLNAFMDQVVDLVILPSIQEGSSLVVLDALAMGKPAVLTDVGAAREAAALAPNVVVVPRACPELLALRLALVERLTLNDRPPNFEAFVEGVARQIVNGTPRNPRADRVCAALRWDRIAAEYLAIMKDHERHFLFA